MEVSGQLHASVALIPGKQPPFYRGLGGPHSLSELYEEKKKHNPAGNRTPSIQPIACLYTNWAIPILNLRVDLIKMDLKEIGYRLDMAHMTDFMNTGKFSIINSIRT
jgi:hypothetical protein